MLLVARAGLRRRCRGRCWGYVPGLQLVLPSIPLMNSNRRPITLHFYGGAVLALNSRTPFPVVPCLVRCTYHVRRNLIDLYDSLPTINRALVRHHNCVLGENRGDTSRVPVVECVVRLNAVCVKLLGHLWIKRVFLFRLRKPLKVTFQISLPLVLITSSRVGLRCPERDFRLRRPRRPTRGLDEVYPWRCSVYG